jgi:hypothetical protein
MTRKRCIRKVWGHYDPIALAIAGATITAEADLDKLRMRELAAIESFSKGVATPQDFRDLCDLLNVAETMGEMGIGPEVLPVCEAVESQLLRAKGQYEAAGRMTLTSLGLKALRDLYEFHDLQRTAVDRSTYEKAIQKTRNKVRGAHPSVRVLA